MSEPETERATEESSTNSELNDAADADVLTADVLTANPTETPIDIDSTKTTDNQATVENTPDPSEQSQQASVSTQNVTHTVEGGDYDWIKTKTGPNETRVRHSSGDGVSGIILRSETPPTSRPSSQIFEHNQPNRAQTPPTQKPDSLESGQTSTERSTSQSDSSPRAKFNFNDLTDNPLGPDVRRRSPRMRGSASAMEDLGSPRPSSAHRHIEDSPPKERRYSGTQLHRRQRRRSNRMLRGDDSLEEDADNLAKSTPVYGPVGRSPKDVENQSEEVLKNYMYERYNMDCIDKEGETIPSPPSIINNFSPSAHSNLAQVGRQLAVIGDQINDQYAPQFQSMTKLLSIRPDAGAMDAIYDVFKSVCIKLFREEINWGRIVALLQFGYHMAMSYLEHGVGDFMSSVITFLIRFIAEVKIVDRIREVSVTISEWIANQGGWIAALDEVRRGYTPSTRQLVAVGCVIALVTGYIWWKRST